jgi:putative ABC transport system substrate-binding protein
MHRREILTLIGGLAASAGWSRATRAQQPRMPVVGLLHPATPAGYAHIVAALRQGLSETGHVEGRNLAIEFRWGEDHIERLPELAADLVRHRVSVIVAGGLSAALAAQAATTMIPIVFSVGTDPVKAGLVAGFNRPGGNITGLLQFNDSLVTKRLEMMRELVPKASVIGLLVDPKSVSTTTRSDAVQAAARAVGQQLRVLYAASQEQFDEVFATATREQIGALLVSNATVFTNGRERLVALAARHALPTSYEYREFVAAGGLLSYGANHRDEYRQVGAYAGRILRGEKPADMPVIQTTKFELTINLRTAKTLGLTVPLTLQAAADEVIE